MPKFSALCGAAFLCLALSTVHAQLVDSTAGKVLNYPTRFFGKLQSKLTGLNNQLTSQTQQYLQKMASREATLEQKLMSKDSVSAKQLFGGVQQQYAALIQKMKSDTGRPRQKLSGQYMPYADSLQGELGFLKKNPQLLNGVNPATVQGPMTQLQAMQAKLQDANAAKLFIQQRQQQIAQYMSLRPNLQSLESKYTVGINQDAYYYTQRVNQYKDMLNDPGKMGQQALSMVSGLPAYQNFMKANGQLAGLFSVPGGGGDGSTAQPLPGLQTNSQITSQVQNQVSAAASNNSGGSGGGGGMGQVQSKVDAAQSELDSYKAKLSALGAGNTTAGAASFRPNDQKTKTLWHRLEYGINFQTTTSSYFYPTTTDFGGSLGYRLGHNNVIGIGASFNMGWGSSIQHIAITGQGVGLRSFLQIGLKNGFSATGGYEYNYATPFSGLSQLRQIQYWSRSALVGVTKTISLKSKVFSKTQVQLLWDFLSYYQVPQTEPLVFRVGYTF